MTDQSRAVEPPLYGLRIVRLDERRNEITELGGAAWPTEQERDENLARIPDAGRHTGYLLDVLDPNDSITDDRHITREVAAKLLGKIVGEVDERKT